METIGKGGGVHNTSGDKAADDINNDNESINSLQLRSVPNRKGSNVSFSDNLDILHEFHKKRPVSMDYAQSQTWKDKYTSCRWIVTYLVFTMFSIVVINTHCMSIALMCMVKNLTNSGNSSTSDYMEYYVDWDTKVQGQVLLSFFIFLPVTPALFGYLSGKFGGKFLVVALIVSISISNMLIPVCAHFHPYVVLGLRAFSGLCAGGVLPTLIDVLSRWTPLNEKSQMTALVFSAQNFASILTNTVSGFVCGIPIQGGWPFIFYIFGGFSLLCLIPWIVCVYDYPIDHPKITSMELAYIDRNRKRSTSRKQSKSPPWKKIFSSKPFWSILIAFATTVFVYVILGIFLPIYVNDVLHYSISENGVLSSLPFIGRFFGGILSGILADFIFVRGYLSITNLRKVFQVFGCVMSAPCLVIVSFLDSERRVLAIILIVLFWTIQSTTNSAYKVNVLDIAPGFVGILNGLTTTVGGVARLIAPFVSASIITSGSREEWQIMINICVGVSVAGAVFYAVFASGKEQDWAKDIKTGVTVNIDSIMELRKLSYDSKGYDNDINIEVTDIITQQQSGMNKKITIENTSDSQLSANNQLATTTVLQVTGSDNQDITAMLQPNDNQLTSTVKTNSDNQDITTLSQPIDNQLTTTKTAKVDIDNQEITTLTQPTDNQLTTTIKTDSVSQDMSTVLQPTDNQLTTTTVKSDSDNKDITTLTEQSDNQLTTTTTTKTDSENQKITKLSQPTDNHKQQ